MRKDNSFRSANDTLVCTGIICFFLFVFRLWPLVLLVLFVGLFLTGKRLFESLKTKPNNQELPLETRVQAPVFEKTDYDFIVEQVSFYINDVYPNAKWVWEKPNAWTQIQSGEDVYVRLNKAGGYNKVKVCITDKGVTGIEVMSSTGDPTDAASVEVESEKDDSERVAFEWVDSHIAELNEKCNDVIGQGNNELILAVSDLPEEKYWEGIREELVKAGLENVEIIPEKGIKIKLK